MLSKNLFVWGDSIARGVMYDEMKERYTVCRETFDQALKTLGVNVRNYAKPGCTSKAALDIPVWSVVQPRMAQWQPSSSVETIPT